MAANDFLYDFEQHGPMIADGDFVVGRADKQHLRLLAETSPGAWRFSPATGIGLMEEIQDSVNAAALRARITEQVLADGGRVQTLTIAPDGAVTLEGYYP